MEALNPGGQVEDEFLFPYGLPDSKFENGKIPPGAYVIVHSLIIVPMLVIITAHFASEVQGLEPNLLRPSFSLSAEFVAIDQKLVRDDEGYL